MFHLKIPHLTGSDIIPPLCTWFTGLKLSGCDSCVHPPEGRLIQLLSLPSFSNRLFLKWPFLFLTLGFSWYIWWMMMFSSRSTMSISLSASSCSLFLSCSSCSFCSSAARASASSHDLSSCREAGEDEELTAAPLLTPLSWHFVRC